ncbi:MULTISPECIES: hypothetical protein [unclassified Brevibacillus]|uniref:hypothetical protein n=1 Tax=unclassified Brevibacillus TaxID=2684853 RepID=UPI0035634E46
MNHLIHRLEQLQMREAVVHEKLKTCITYQSAILDFTIREGFRCQRTAIEDIVLAVNRIEMDLRTECCQLKLELALITSEMQFTEGATT